MSDLLAVFGNPILHSKSPLMFNALLQEQGFYTRIKATNAADVVEAIRLLQLKGANITAPFKEDIIPLVDELSEEVKIIGGANTIVNNDGHLTAYNTDWYGAMEAIKQSGLLLKGLRVTVLGLGGAGKAVVYGLIREGAQVTVVNRTQSKAIEVAERMKCSWTPIEKLDETLKQSQLFVSTISPGAVAGNLVGFPKDLWIFDANYHASPLIEIAKKQGNPVVDASQWLLYQAVMAFERLFQTTPSLPTMAEALNLPTKKDIRVVGICNTPLGRWHNDEVWITSKPLANSTIKIIQPDMVIYAPKLSPLQIEELYHYERDKAFAR